jgi:MHS family proline/betaine transporter-like MFS transporter
MGRRGTLAVVVLLMSGATFLIGVAPTYAQVGVLAPIILAFARALQGFSAGGEFGGATSFMIEYAPEGKRGLYGSWQAFTQGVAAGVGVTLGVVLSSALPEEAFNAWGWRIPFLVALPFGLIGLYLRLRLEDTPHFRAVRETREVEAAPLRETVRFHGADILKVVGTIVFGTALTYLLIYLPTYSETVLGLPRFQALMANLIGILALLIVCPTSAVLSERIGRKPFLVYPALGTAVLALPIFWLLQGPLPAVVLAHVGVGVLLGLFGGLTRRPSPSSSLRTCATAPCLWATAPRSPSSGEPLPLSLPTFSRGPGPRLARVLHPRGRARILLRRPDPLGNRRETAAGHVSLGYATLADPAPRR